jgi:ferredoxin
MGGIQFERCPDICYIVLITQTRGGFMATPVVDFDLCIGCGSCVELCPEVFELRDDKAWVIGPDKCNTCDCEEAMNVCPTEAIKME